MMENKKCSKPPTSHVFKQSRTQDLKWSNNKSREIFVKTDLLSKYIKSHGMLFAKLPIVWLSWGIIRNKVRLFLAEHARVYHLMSLAEPVQHTQDIPGHLPQSWQVEMGPTGLEHPTHGVSVGKRTGAFRWPLQDGISGFLNVGKRHQLSSIVHCCGWEYPVHEATVILLTLDILRHKVTFSIAKGKVNMIIWLVVLIILEHIIQ